MGIQIKFRQLIVRGLLVIGVGLLFGITYAETNVNSGKPITIGVLSDMSGFFSDSTGSGTVVAAKIAVEEFGGTILGRPIQVITGDHQHKADIGAGIARRWIEREEVDLITGIDNSAVALAVQAVGDANEVITISTGAGAETLTEEQCTRYGIHYVYDTYALAVGLVRALYDDSTRKWFIVGSDYAFGHAMAASAQRELEELGGEVLDAAFAPINTHDFASFILRAQNSKADVIGFANAGAETVNAIKAAESFGLVAGGQQLAGFLITLPDIKSMGLDAAQGLQFVTAFYWDRNEKSRVWSQRFFEVQGAMPTMMQVGVYSAVKTYLEAVTAVGTTKSDAVREALSNIIINDSFTSNGRILPNGLMLHDMYLAKVKKPSDSTGEWDLLEIEKVIPSSDAFRPLDLSQCQLLG